MTPHDLTAIRRARMLQLAVLLLGACLTLVRLVSVRAPQAAVAAPALPAPTLLPLPTATAPLVSAVILPQGGTTRSPGVLSNAPSENPARVGDSPAVGRIPPGPMQPPALDGTQPPSPWLTHELNPGLWTLNAGLGIVTVFLSTINDALRLAVLYAFGDLRLDCTNTLNIVFCTPKALFLEASGGASVGGIVRLAWSVLQPLALSLITLLFVVRIGRLIADGPHSLAAEGRQLLLSLILALLMTLSVESILGLLFDLQNGLHAALLAHAQLGSLQQLLSIPVALNPGVAFSMLLLLITMAALVIRAVTRVLHLTLLLAVAPLMGALLMDSSTSARFGAWFTRLLEVLLRQTAWVFIFWVGTHLFQMQGALTDPAQQVTGALLLTMVMLSALMGDSVLGSVLGAGGGTMTSRLSGIVRPMALLHLARRQISSATSSARHPEPASIPPTADPARSQAAQRPDTVPQPVAALSSSRALAHLRTNAERAHERRTPSRRI